MNGSETDHDAGRARKRASGQAVESSEDSAGESALFPVTLFVAVVGKGVLDPGTPSTLLKRLQRASKDQIISISLWDTVVELKLRVFVADGEDAKAMRTYIELNDEQVPAPVVVLCPKLPVAMQYDPLTVDPKIHADLLIKQAKSRAVKLVHKLVCELLKKTDNLSSDILFGSEGHSAPVKHLAESFERSMTSVINPETKERGIIWKTGGKNRSSAASAAGPADVNAKELEPLDPRQKKKSKVKYGVRACIGLGLRI
jgi:hypothetical protein